EMERLLPQQPRVDVIRASLAAHGALIEVPDLRAAVALSNRLAPEHLELAVAEPHALLPAVRNAGAVFMGHHTPEALGVFGIGSSHVLPSGGTVGFSYVLGLYAFQRRLSVVEASATGVRQLAVTAGVMADAEGLHAHAQSARICMGEKNGC